MTFPLAELSGSQVAFVQAQTKGPTRYAAAYGIVNDPTLSVDQTSTIRSMITSLTAEQFGGDLIWPAGDICFNGPIDWSGCGALSANTYSSNNTRLTPPAFIGSVGATGGTRFRMLNAAGNVAAFTFGVTTTQVAAGVTRVVAPVFRNCDFYGPGNAVQKATLSATANAGVTFSVTQNVAAAGDACVLINGSRTFWMTVESVSGSGPYTITTNARQAILSSFATSGTTVLFFKQSRLLQIGGLLTTQSTICEQVKIDNCRFFNAFQALCFDDNTTVNITNSYAQNVIHKFSYGYNCDQFTVIQPWLGSDKPVLTATCTNGSPNITATVNGSVVKVGEKIYESANNDGTLNFPENTYVLSTDGTNIVLSENYSGTAGSKSLNVVCGSMFNMGQGGVAFRGNYSGNTLNNFTSTVVFNPTAGRIDRLINNGDTVGLGFNSFGGYLESSQRLMTHGQLGGSGGGGPFKLDNLIVQGIDACTGPLIEDFLGGKSIWDLRIAGVGTARFPIFQTRAFQPQIHLREGWAWDNESTAALGYGQVSPPIVNLSTTDGNTAVAIVPGAEWSYNIGSFGKVSGSGALITNSSFSGALNFNWPGIGGSGGGLDLTLVGNLTQGSIIYGMPPKGYLLPAIFRQDGTGGRTVTLGSDYVKADGTAVTFTGSAAGKVAMTQFLSDGTHLVLQGNQSPAFI